jgi:hypothetical protein
MNHPVAGPLEAAPPSAEPPQALGEDWPQNPFDEALWIERKYPGAKIKMTALAKGMGTTRYNVVVLILPDGREEAVYIPFQQQNDIPRVLRKPEG